MEFWRKNNVLIFVGDYTSFKVVKSIRKKSDATVTLLLLNTDYIIPQELSIECIRTGNGGEFKEAFQCQLGWHSITYEHTPPNTPQNNGR